MPSASIFAVVLALVARCTKSVRQMAFGCCAAACAADVRSRPLTQNMFCRMLGGANNRKVFDAIIQRIAVLVVNVSSWRRVDYYTMLVRPFVGLRDFHAHVYKPIAGFMQPFGTYRQHHADFCKDGAFDFSYGSSKSFSSAILASTGVAVRIAVNAFCAYDLCTAKRAWLKGKFFGHGVFYANKHRNANAF